VVEVELLQQLVSGEPRGPDPQGCAGGFVFGDFPGEDSDEVMELDRRGAELLFQVLTEREEKNSIASNESFSGWTKTFADPRLCAAIVDRLTFNGATIETGTDSYRLAHSLNRVTPG
jgi:hypothetical protein